MLIASAHSDSLIYFVPYSFCLTREPGVLSASHPAPLPSPENLPPDTGDSEKLIFKAILSLGIHPLLFLRRNLARIPCQTFSTGFMHAVPAAYSYAFLPAGKFWL
jgi:hypothetical protein